MMIRSQPDRNGRNKRKKDRKRDREKVKEKKINSA